MRTKLGLSIALVLASLVAGVARADAVPGCGPFEHREGHAHESECRFGPECLCSSVDGPGGGGGAPVLCLLGLLLFFALLHVVRGLGQLHGLLAKHLLVRRA